MNSIASMTAKTPPPKPSKYAMAFAAALTESGRKDADLARALGVAPTMVYQWKTGRRPIGYQYAEAASTVLRVAPEQISEAYAEFQASASNVVPITKGRDGDQRRHDLVIARLENDVDSLRYALGAMVAVMTSHRPAEGVDVAKALRKHVPPKFVQQGYIAELLKVLEKQR